MKLSRDPLLRRSVCAAGQPARPQVSRCTRLSGNDRKFPRLTGRSGTQRARRTLSGTTPGSAAPWSSSPPSELRITRVFSCVARGLKARADFMFGGGCRWRSLAVDGSSGASRGHAPVVRRPGSRWGRRRGTTFRFSGRTYPQLARIVRVLCAVAGRRW